jgi:hypothetical protein
MTRTLIAGVTLAALLVLPGSAGAMSLAQLDDPGSCVASGAAPASCTQAGALAQPSAVTISPDGTSVYVGAGGIDPANVGERSRGGGLSWLKRDPKTGLLSPGGCYSDGGADGLTPTACTPVPGLQSSGRPAISPDGSGVYVVGSTATGAPGETDIGLRVGAPVLHVFARDWASGALIPTSCVSAAGGACTRFPVIGSPTVSSDGKFVYTTAGARIGVLRRFSENTLEPVTTIKLRGDVQDLVLSPDGRFAWASVYADRADGQYGGFGLVTFTRDATKGTLRQRACTVSTAMPKALARGCTRTKGNKVPGVPMLASDGTGYVREGQSGTLLPVRAVGGTLKPAGAEVHRVYGELSLAPDGSAAYRTDGIDYGGYGFGSVTLFGRNASTGALAAPDGAAGCMAEAVGDVSHAGEYQYAPHAPPCAQGHAIGGSSAAVPSPDGRFVYVSSSLSTTLPGAVTVFAVRP